MYVWSHMVTHIARVWINRVRLPVLHVVSWTGKMNISLSVFVPENLVTGSAVPSRVSLLISILRLNLVLTYGIPPEFCGGVHLFIFNHLRRHGASAALAGHHGPTDICLYFPHPLLILI